MKEIISTNKGFIVVENGVVIEEFDRDEVLYRLLLEQKQRKNKIYQELQLQEDRLSGFGWEYSGF